MSSRYGLEIRGASAGDAPGLAELMAAAGLAVSAAALAERIEAVRQGQGAVLIAAEWAPPSGVIALHWRQTLTAALPVAGIDLLLVGPEDQRRGIGRLLLKAASQQARSAGCGVMRLTAATERADMQGFCLATGFSETGATFERPLRKKS